MFGEYENCLFQNENNGVLNENSVEGKPCINRKVRALRSKFSYTVVMMNMKLLVFVTPPSIYHSQILIDECPGYGVQAISRFQPQYENMTFDEQIRYNIMFHQVVHKGG